MPTVHNRSRVDSQLPRPCFVYRRFSEQYPHVRKDSQIEPAEAQDFSDLDSQNITPACADWAAEQVACFAVVVAAACASVLVSGPVADDAAQSAAAVSVGSHLALQTADPLSPVAAEVSGARYLDAQKDNGVVDVPSIAIFSRESDCVERIRHRDLWPMA
jgi:hypothetical protein